MTAEINPLGPFRQSLSERLKAVKPNATYKDPAELKEYLGYDLVKGTLHSIESGARYRFIGEAGIGKTSFMKWITDVMGLRLVVIPAAQISIENLMLPFPLDDEDLGRKVLEMVFYKHFTKQHDDDRYVIYIDEPGRADTSLGNTIMELIQEGTLAGRELEGLVTVVATDNPEGSAYGKMAGLDFSQADRFNTVILGANGTPWRRALAEEFSDTDLTQLFSVYARLDEDLRRTLNPRVLGNMIMGVKEGFPAIWTLPIIQGSRVRLIDKAGNDKTSRVLDDVCSALGVINRETISDGVKKAVQFAVRNHKNVFFEGGPGIGKTSYIKALLREMKIGFEYDSAPLLQPEDMTIPFPGKDGKTLELMPTRKFLRDTEFMWVIDEIWRAPRRTQSALMPILQEKEIGGERIENLIGSIALNNPKQVAGFKLDVGKCDLAAATRFALSLQLTAEDIPSSTYLYDKYGEAIATPFVEWWQDDLDDNGRALCTPRCTERMIELYLAESGPLDLQWALPYVNGEYVGVPLVDLKARLEKNPMARLRQIINNLDYYVDELKKGDAVNSEVQATVFLALSKAELKQLQANFDAAVILMANLAPQHKITLIRSSSDRQKFWHEVLMQTGSKKK